MIRSFRYFAPTLALFVSLSLAACGGGGHAESEGDGHDAHAKADGHGDSKHASKDKHGAKDKHGSGGHGSSGHGSSGHESAEHGDEDGDAPEMVEVDLGEYTVTQRQVEQSSILMIRFRIFGVVDREKKDKFEKLLAERKQRMRDSVITIVQRADAEQLSDPNLGWLKSEIIPSVNRLVKNRILKDVVFSDFAMLQN